LRLKDERYPLDHAMRQSIETAVQIMRSHPEYSGEEIFHRLLEAGLDRPVAVQLIVLLPDAYARVGLDGCGVLFSNEYLCLGEGGVPCRQGWLDDLPVWREAIAFARQEVTNGASGDALLAVAGRSARITSINKALHDGKKLRNLVCSPTVSLWPEFAASLTSGKVAEQKLPWWRIRTWFERSLPGNYSRAEKGMAAAAIGAAILVGLFAIGLVAYYAISAWRAAR
jgi:hypothetical protein